jgi:hypothetical protein
MQTTPIITSANPVVQQDPQLIFEQLEAYDWDDPEFLVSE